MAVTFTDIIIGAATVYIGDTIDTVVDVGSTQDGVEIAWEPDMVDIEVDQFGDAARVVVNKTKVTLKTKLAESTLRNLSYAWNIGSTNLSGTATGSMASSALSAASGQLKIPIQSVNANERVIRMNGQAPGATVDSTRIRTYTHTRCIQYASSSHMLKRSENVGFPVEFRVLPNSNYVGYEYGWIVDQPTAYTASAAL